MPIIFKYREEPLESPESMDALVAGCAQLIENLPADPFALADHREKLEHERAKMQSVGAHQATGVLMLALACVDRKMVQLSPGPVQ